MCTRCCGEGKKREAAPNGFPIASYCMGEAVLHGTFRVEYIDLFEIIRQVFPFIGTQNPERKGKQGPQMNHGVIATVMFTEFMDLSMAIMAGSDAVIGTGGLNLIIFDLSKDQTLILKS